MSMTGPSRSLEDLAGAVPEPFATDATDRPLPPVETWNPPDCGTIDMRIARDGTWYYRGTPILRPALVKLFSTILRKDGTRYVLVTPVEKVGIVVEDVPFLAVEMAVTGEPEAPVLWLRTNVGDKARVDAEHPLTFETGAAGGIVPYVLVRRNLRARLTRALTLDLVARAVARDHQGTQWLGVVSAGRFFAIAPAQPTPAVERCDAWP
jgi:hypothetical protein